MTCIAEEEEEEEEVMGDELPSFSMARLRRRGRRLDYNAPLLSVRRAVADAGSLWKLSSELKSEPVRATCAVPFEWELRPGRPKQPPPSSPPAPNNHSPPSVFAAPHSVSSSQPPSSPSSPSSSSSPHSSNLHHDPPFPRACPSPPFHVPFPPPALLQHQQQDHTFLLQLLPQPHLDEHHLVHKPNNVGVSAEGDDESQTKPEAVSTNCRLRLDESQNGCFPNAFFPTSSQGAVGKPWTHRAALGSPGNGDSDQLLLADTDPKLEQDTSAANYHSTPRKVGFINPLRFLSLGLRTAFAQACRRALASVGSLSRIKCKVAPSRLVDAVAHRSDSPIGSDEEEFVVREVKATLQCRRNQKSELTPVIPYSPGNTSFTVCSLRYATNNVCSSRYSSSLKGSPLHGQARNSSIASPSPVHDQAEIEGEEPLFYDAPSRFDSQTSTPGRATHGASLSLFDEGIVPSGLPKNSISDGTIFVDGASSRFETPRASVSDVCKIVGADSGLQRDGSLSSMSTESKSSSSLSQRVGKALRLDTRETQAWMTEMKGASRQCFPRTSYLGKLQEQQLKFLNGSCSRLWRHRSKEFCSYKGEDSLIPGLISPIFPAKCGSLRNEVSAAEEMGWPLGLSSSCSDTQMRFPRVAQKDAQDCILGVSVPSPPLPPSPSCPSWLHKALSSTALKPSPLAGVRVVKAGSVKNNLEVSPSEAQGEMGRENMVKNSRMPPGN